MSGVFLHVCVSCSGGFNIRGFECCSLLWCNTGATDKSELINGKLLLMIVKMLLSPHVVLGHLSATEMDLQAQTHSHTSHTLISCFVVAVATIAESLSLCPFTISLPLSVLYPTSCFHELILLSSFFFSLANKERES